MVELKHEADVAIAHRRQARAAHGRELFTAEANPPGARQIERADAVQQRALAGTRLPDDGQDLPGVDGQIDALQHLEGAPHVLKALLQVFDR